MVSVVATGYLCQDLVETPIPHLPPALRSAVLCRPIQEVHQGRRISAATTPRRPACPRCTISSRSRLNMPMLVRYCIYYFVITPVIAAISLYIPFRYTDSGTAGDLTSILFPRHHGFGLHPQLVPPHPQKPCGRDCDGSHRHWIPAHGRFRRRRNCRHRHPHRLVFLRHCPATTTTASRWPLRVWLLPLTLAWFASMDSIGNVVAPFIIDGIAKVLGTSTSTIPSWRSKSACGFPSYRWQWLWCARSSSAHAAAATTTR